MKVRGASSKLELSSARMHQPSQLRHLPSQRPSIEYIKWRIKGGAAAGPSDDFAFDFTQDKNGKVLRDKTQIVDYIKQKGPFQVDGYEITMSKDWKFLQRKRV